MQPENNNAVNIEERKVSTSVKIIIGVLVTLIIWSVSGGIFYANLQNDIDGKADKGEFEKFKAIDSVNTRNIFIKLDKIEEKFDRLIENNNSIKIPKSIKQRDDENN